MEPYKLSSSKQTQAAPSAGAGARVELIAIPSAPRRDGFDIAKFRSALKQAESVDSPSRTMLYDLYNEIMIDAHLSSVIGKRLDNARAMDITFESGAKPNEAINTLLGSPWFSEMISDVLEARFWGYTAAWLDLSGAAFRKYKLLPRKHIVPSKGLFLNKQDDRHGVAYTVPPYANYVITAGETDDLGMLLKAVSWVLFKRGDVSDWATFNELFAAPFRKGKYPQYNEEAKKALAEACRDAGSMSYAIIPNETDIEFIHSGGGSSGSTDAYERFAEFCDKQISKIFLRNTLTTDAEGGAYKGAVHQQSEEGVIASDRRYVLGVLNTRFKELLQIHGFNPGEGRFVCVEEDHICLQERIEIDMKVNTVVEIDPEYWYKKYGYPIPKGGPKLKGEAATAAELKDLRAELSKQRDHFATLTTALVRRLDDAVPIEVTTAKPRHGFFV